MYPRFLSSQRQWLVVAFLAFVASFTDLHAETLRGVVIGLADGDTMTLLDSAKVQYKIRLSGIDAPEKRQPFGNRSKENLSALAFGQQVVIEWGKTDRYGRIIGKVLVNGRDAGLEQIRCGLAWHYKAYMREQSATDRALYSAAEVEARSAKRGLWGEQGPMPPWEFRRR
ncbi:MAG: nuclease [Burkholderiales bacterium PBB6]|nr:MAG: nuclease [Burkholderiales bacterium PBB6]